MTEEQEYKMEQAVKLYNNNCDCRTIMQIENITLALKKFIAINRSFEERDDAILPKVFSFIALCNYKMGNYNRAYRCAKKSVELGKELMDNSILVTETNLFLDPEVFALIEYLEEKHADEIDFSQEYIEGEENIYEDSTVDDLLSNAKRHSQNKPSEDQIRRLIVALSDIHKGNSNYRNADGAQSFHLNQLIDAFKMPLFCAWRLYKYGWHTDFMEEGDSLFPYLMFEANALGILNDLINLLRNDSPFKIIERNGMITNGLIDVYSQLLSDLQKDNVKL